MLYLSVSIFLTSFIYIIFKLFPKYGVDPLSAIVISYVGRVIFGFIIAPAELGQYFTKIPLNLFLLAATAGVTFIIVFALISRSTREMGVSSTTIISRMSMVIPAGFSIVFYGDNLGWMKISGIFIALLAIFFTVYQKEDKTITTKVSRRNMLLPVFLFMGSGIADTILKISQKNYMPDKPDFLFIDVLFSASALAGIIALAANRVPIKKVFKKQNILWGLTLGGVNYVSLLLFIIALASGRLQGSQIFPINSVGIVLTSAVLSILIFREKLSNPKIAGLVLAVGAILLISLG